MNEKVKIVATEGRLDYLIRGWGYLSKQQIREYIKKGLITVNGICVNQAWHTIRQGDIIEIEGKRVTPNPFVYLMVNKPSGFSCMDGDIRYPYLVSLIGKEYPVDSLFCVGRLDVDTEGLILITNDGYMTSMIAHPEKSISKKYYAEFNVKLRSDTAMRMSKGLSHTNGTQYSPAVYEELSDTSAYITVTEGKYHEVKRLVGACGGMVTYLKRVAIGNMQLDDTLKPGEYREITVGEYNSIFD